MFIFILEFYFKIDVMYDDKPLNNELTLIDVGYIYAWRKVKRRFFVGLSFSTTQFKIFIFKDGSYAIILPIQYRKKCKH